MKDRAHSSSARLLPASPAGSLAFAAAEGAYFNFLINLKGISDKNYVSETLWKAKNGLQEAIAEKEKNQQIAEKLLSLEDRTGLNLRSLLNDFSRPLLCFFYWLCEQFQSG